MKRISQIVTILFALLIIPGISQAEEVKNGKEIHMKYLYLLEIESGTFDGKQLLVFANPKVIYFTDNPKPTAGYVKLKDFIHQWGSENSNLHADPPSALLSIFKSGTGDNTVLELKMVAFKYSTIKFDVDIIAGELPSSFKQATLFINGVESSHTDETR